MLQKRIIEHDNGIQDEFSIEIHDKMMKRIRDKGWLHIDSIIDAGLQTGKTLEIGSGPGYIGLEWLKKTKNTTLIGLEISTGMIKKAQENLKDYKMISKVQYVVGDAHKLPFTDSTFDNVFSNASLHEWKDPIKVFNEIYRVLKTGGTFYIRDMRRDMKPMVKLIMIISQKPKEVRTGIKASINASYVYDELIEILKKSKIIKYDIILKPMEFEIIGKK